MAFIRLNFGKDWTKEADFPTYQNSEAQVRADLQYHPNALRDFINSHLAALEASAAAGTIGAMHRGAAATIQSVLDGYAQELEALAEDIRTVSSGGVPSVVRSTEVTFSAESWASTADGVSLTIAKTEHKRENESFGYNLYELMDGLYKGGTKGTAATGITCNANGSITLTAEEAYSGRIVFFGM